MTSTISIPEVSLINSVNALDVIIDRIKTRTKAYQIDTGLDLLAAKEILPHGEFLPWVKANIGFSASNAQNLMNAAKLVLKNPIIGVLAPTAVMALAAPNTPEVVRSEVVAEIQTGKTPTPKEVKARIAIAKPPKLAKTNKATATMPRLPANDASKIVAEQGDQDLVKRLRAAGLEGARAAFKTAFPDCYIVNGNDESKGQTHPERDTCGNADHAMLQAA